MRNPYLTNLSKLEFVVTDACTGRCKHCSAGDHTRCDARLDPQVAADAVRRIAAEYAIETVMTFGGEPLLHVDAVCAIMTVAQELGIPKRQVITNGYVSKNAEQICAVVERLAACGVNDLLLSVDAFHQETIPLDVVQLFAKTVKDCGIPMRLSPAWLVSRSDDNPYNRKTRTVLECFLDPEIPVGEGNVIFPEGNALRYLSEYFADARPENPYVENPRDVRCLSFSANGDLLNGNVYRQDLMEILECYQP